jgi:hypothetical protein
MHIAELYFRTYVISFCWELGKLPNHVCILFPPHRWFCNDVCIFILELLLKILHVLLFMLVQINNIFCLEGMVCFAVLLFKSAEIYMNFLT